MENINGTKDEHGARTLAREGLEPIEAVARGVLGPSMFQLVMSDDGKRMYLQAIIQDDDEDRPQAFVVWFDVTDTVAWWKDEETDKFRCAFIVSALEHQIPTVPEEFVARWRGEGL